MSDPFYLNDYKHQGLSTPSQYYSAGCRLVGLPPRAGGPQLLRPHRLSLREHRPPPPTSGSEPLAAPVLDYNRTFALSPEATGGIGGEVKLDLNATNIARVEALYQSTAPTRSTGLQALQRVRYDTSTSCGGYKPHLQHDAASTRPRTTACCAASAATTRAPPSRSPGSANSSTRSARSGLRSSSPGSTAKRRRSQRAATYAYGGGQRRSSILRSRRISSAARRPARPRRAMAGVGLEYRYPLISDLRLRQADLRADRPAHRAAQRSHAQAAAQRGRAEPRLRRNQPVRLGQVFRLRSHRRRHAPQLRPAIHRQFRQRRPRQHRRAASRSSSLARTPTRSPTRPTPGSIPASTGILELRRRRDARAVLRALLADQQAAVRQLHLRAQPPRRHRASRLRRLHHAASTTRRYAAQP